MDFRMELHFFGLILCGLLASTITAPTTPEPETIVFTTPEPGPKTPESETMVFTTQELGPMVFTTPEPGPMVFTTPEPGPMVFTTPEPETMVFTTPEPETMVFTTPEAMTTMESTTTKMTTTKEPKPTSDFRETIIFLKKSTQHGQDVFIIGRNLNKTVTDTKIPIRHMDLQINKKIDPRNSWTHGDNFLDWIGREDSQTRLYNGDYARGTPAQWTTNNRRQDYYSALNKYGDNYWLVRVEMDCLKTNNGFFEVRGVMNYGAREYISRSIRTGGTQCKAGNITPPGAQYHVGMCGKINIFTWGTRNCRIVDLD